MERYTLISNILIQNLVFLNFHPILVLILFIAETICCWQNKTTVEIMYALRHILFICTTLNIEGKSKSKGTFHKKFTVNTQK
jgi:hypothetical protein